MKQRCGAHWWVVRGAFALLAVGLMGSFASAQKTDEWVVSPRRARKKNPIPGNSRSLAEGKKLYVRECLSCHGAGGKGNGPEAKDLEKPVPDFTTAKAAAQTDGALFWKTTMGRTPMPGYRKTLSKKQRWHLVNYMRSLMPREQLAEPRYAAPDAFRQSVSGVLAGYLKIQRALAKEDPRGVIAAVAVLADAVTELKGLNGEPLAPKTREAWRSAADTLRAATRSLREAEGLRGQREAFQTLSKALTATLTTFGHAEPRALRLFRSTRPFGKGDACWIQQGGDTRPRNPYFEATMQRSGELQRQLGGKKIPSAQ